MPLLRDRTIAKLSAGNYRQLARDTGLSRQHISRVLRGMRGLSLDSANLICAAARVSLDQLNLYIESETT